MRLELNSDTGISFRILQRSAFEGVWSWCSNVATPSEVQDAVVSSQLLEWYAFNVDLQMSVLSEYISDVRLSKNQKPGPGQSRHAVIHLDSRIKELLMLDVALAI
eukprot:5255124-Amphidinium_carterae.1